MYVPSPAGPCDGRIATIFLLLHPAIANWADVPFKSMVTLPAAPKSLLAPAVSSKLAPQTAGCGATENEQPEVVGLVSVTELVEVETTSALFIILIL